MPTETTNKKAFFDYQILEKYEAGIVLTGQEVRSIKGGNVSLMGSYVVIDEKLRPWLINAHVALYIHAATQARYDPLRSRKLLLKKKELNYLLGKTKIKGLTLIPLKIYTKGGLIKVEIGLAKHKRSVDKREIIKKRELDRDIKQRFKNY